VRRRRARPRKLNARPLACIAAVVLALAALAVAYRVWTPGLDVTDGRHDRGRNAIWLQHGWLGSDDWFRREHKQDHLADFRDAANIQRLAGLLRAQHITDVFPHVSPADKNGDLPAVDHAQTERFLDAFAGFRVMPWTGGVVDKTCRICDAKWRRYFVESIIGLLARHPRFVGVHINIEPCESGNQDFLKVLDGLRQALPDRFLLSVAASPPPLWWQPFREVQWDGKYFRDVAQRADQLAVMMYDTGLPWPRAYQHVMRRWTHAVLTNAAHASILLGVPAYNDPGSGYHNPAVENLANALRGIHAALAAYPVLPEPYQGVAIYCEWEMDDAEWQYWQHHFVRTTGLAPVIRSR
jgi:hypothetical protein